MYGVPSAPRGSCRAGLLSVAVLCLLGALFSGSSGAARSARESPLDVAARAATREFGVPARLLVAVAQVDTHGRMPAGETQDGGWGVMHLVTTRDDDQLRLAARLAHVTPRAARHDLAANVSAGAALLARLAEGRPQRLAGWRRPLTRFGGSPLFADEVLIQAGVRVPAPRLAAVRASAVADYPGARWAPASPANFQGADRPFTSPITRIVIHTTEAPYAAAIRFFSRPGASASAAYIIRSSDGAVTQMVHERDIAWHAGNRQYNATAIGIEHEAFVHDCSWYTTAMYRSSARLVAFLTRKYGIPIDRAHIIGHYQVPDPHHPGEFGGFAHHIDPGLCWNWPKYMALVRADAGAIPVRRIAEQVVDDAMRTRFRAPGWQRRRPDSTQLFGPAYVFARPRRAATSASFRLAIPKTGDYAVYAWWSADRKRNPSVPFGIDTVTGWHWLTVNERRNGGRWVYLGTFTLPAGTGWDVRVSRNSTARGRIAADALTAEPVGHELQSRLLPGGVGYALTGSGLALTSNAGSTWRTATPPGLAAADIRAVRFLDPANGFVVGLSGSERQVFTLWRTTDGGLTWTSSRLPVPVDVDAAAPISIAAPDASHLFVSLSLQQTLGLPGPGVLLVSSDRGRRWSRGILPGSGEVSFATATRGWLAPVDGGLYATRDGGRTWRPDIVPAPAGFRSTPKLAELPTFSDPTDAVLPVTFRRGARAAVSFLASVDGGATWQNAATVTGRRAAAPAGRIPTTIADATHWIALPDGGSRIVTLAKGQPARTTATAGLPFTAAGFELEDVSFASTTTGWAAVSTCAIGTRAHCTRRETLYRTVDGGATWAPLNMPGAQAPRRRR